MIKFVSSQKRCFTNEIQESTIQECLDYFKDKLEIAIDSETEGFDIYTKKLLTIQLGDFDNQFVIDCKTIDINPLKELLESTDKVFLFHNAKFDLKFLYRIGIYPTSIYDTFLAECVLTTGYEERGLSLKDVVLKYCNVILDKSIRGTIHIEGLTDRVIIYAADDTKYLSSIREKQLEKIAEFGLQNILDIENQVVRVFALMEYHGAPFNPTKWLAVAEQVEANTIELEDKMDAIVFKLGTKHLPETNSITKYCEVWKQGNLFFQNKQRDCNINWASPAQKTQLLIDLGLNVDSVGDKELQKLKSKHEVIPLLIEYSKQHKLSTSFGKEFLKFINPITKRIHGNVWQILSTGRISISEPNINQIPSHGELATRIRAAFEAPEGYKFVGGDYSGMELRIIAEFSQDPVWLGVFNRGGDLHSELCSMTFGIALEDVKKPFPPKPEFKYRDVQKTIDFGLAFGMSEFKLSDTMQISVDEAKKIIRKFFHIVPKVEQFLNMLGQLGKERGYIGTPAPIKRVRWFPQWQEAKDVGNFKVLGAIERQSKNFPIQSTNANITKLAMINIQNRIDKYNLPVQIVMQVYDELQTICREDYAEEWKVILREEMINAAKQVIKTIPVEVDCKISTHWKK